MVTVRACQLTAVLFAIAATLMGLVFAFIVSKRFSYEIPIFEDLEKNFQRSPFVSIKLSHHQCEHPFVSLFQLKWEGVQEYCECWLFTYLEGCSSNQLRQGCYRRGNVPSQSLDKYKGAFVCGERLNGLDYDNIKQVSESESCPENHRQCAKENGYKFCVRNTDSCPVNDLVISSQKRADLVSDRYFELEFESKPFKSHIDFIPDLVTQKPKLYLYYSQTKTNNNFVIDFRLAYQDPCLHPREKLFYGFPHEHLTDYDYYVNFCTKFNDQSLDTRFKHIDDIGFYALLQENGVVSSLEDDINFDLDSINYPIKLYHRGYVQFKDECVTLNEELAYGKLAKSMLMVSLSSRDMASFIDTLFYWLTVVLWVCLFLEIFILYYTCIVKDTDGCNACCSGFVAICMLPPIALFVAAAFYLQAKWTALEAVAYKNCSDQLTNAMIDDSHEQQSKGKILIFIGIAALSFSAILLCAFKVYFEKSSQSRESKGVEYQPLGDVQIELAKQE